MLRAQVFRSRLGSVRPSLGLVTPQWHLNRARHFANGRKPDQTVLPGSESKLAASNIPPPPTTATPPPPPPPVAKTPPSPEQVQRGIPPTGTGTASTGPSIPPKKPKRRFRNFLTTLVILGVFGYAGGVYYALVSDNFHDFFTEYVPFGEDAVAYFEEREFRKRFPNKFSEQKSYPQIRGENKVTIGRQSGLSARPASENTTDLGKSGRHTSAVEENKNVDVGRHGEKAKLEPKQQSVDKSAAQVESDPKRGPPPAASTSNPPSTPAPAPQPPSQPSTPAPLVSNLELANSDEPVVKATVKMLNDLITVINADPAASKYQTTIDAAKSQLQQIVSSISSLKQQVKEEAEKEIASAHRQFDSAAKELVSRLEKDMQVQQLLWREEYEQEREKIAQSYQNKLSAEVDAVQRLASQQTETALVEQQIALQRAFAQQVADRVETERAGRLGKLSELSSSVQELERLTADWNSVISSNLQTQHLHVALEAVRASIQRFDHPTPFVAELAALKEVGNANPVVNAAIASIPPVAYQRGLPTSAHLIDRFRRVAAEVRKAALLPEDAGVASHAASAVLSRFIFSKKDQTGMPAGEDVEAVLTRTENLLEEGDLDGAAREMNGLHGWAGVLSRDWVGECRRVLETRQALDVIATEARLQSLLVE